MSHSRPTFEHTPLKRVHSLAGRVHFASLHASIVAGIIYSDTSEILIKIKM